MIYKPSHKRSRLAHFSLLRRRRHLSLFIPHSLIQYLLDPSMGCLSDSIIQPLIVRHGGSDDHEDRPTEDESFFNNLSGSQF